MNGWRVFRMVTVAFAVATSASLYAQTPPVPKPFPQPPSGSASTPPATTTSKPTSPPAATPPAATPPAVHPAATQTASPAPSSTGPRPLESTLGVKIYPTADFIDSYDAGQGQRFYLFGTDAPVADIVAYYKNVLNKNARQIFEAPLIYQFEIGKFDDRTMAFPPSVVVKDYTWNGQNGYAYTTGTLQRHYKTIIQIVPAK